MIPEVNPYNNYRGDGVATLFDYDFFIQNGSQLIVEHIDKNDVVTRLEENIDYEIVVIEEEFAGYIKFPIKDSKFGILQENETLSLQLTLPFEQISEYGQSSLLDLNSIEFSLDYLTRLCQILKRQMERSVRVNEGSEATPEQLLETINSNAIVSTNAAAIASKKADEAMESANIASGKVEEINNIYAEAVEKIETDKSNAIEEIEQSSSEGIEELNKIKEETKAFKDELVESGMFKFNLFDTKISDHILQGEEALGWALQGTYVSGALYPDFYNKCLDEYQNSNEEVIGFEPWTQPIATANTTSVDGGNMVISASSEYTGSQEYAWKAMDGNTTSTHFSLSSTNTGWWQVKFPYKLLIKGLTYYSRAKASTYPVETATFYTSSDMTRQIGDTFSAPTTDYTAFEVQNIPQDGVITDTIYLSLKGSGSTCGMGELVINAQKLTSDIYYTIYKNNNGHKFYPIEQKSAFDAIYNQYGIADFYGIDEENERVFLPRNKYFHQLTLNTSEVNEMVEAGLPNITGTYSGNGSLPTTGAFYESSTTKGYSLNNLGSTINYLGFDASRSNPIYGNSNTVQPPSSLKLLYYCVGNTEVTQAITNVAEITESENDTLPWGYNFYSGDLLEAPVGYVKSLGQWNDGNIWQGFYDRAVAKIGQPFAKGYIKEYTETYDDYDLVINQDEMTFRLPLLNGDESLMTQKYDELTLGASGQSYIAPANGWFAIAAVTNASGQYVTLLDKESRIGIRNDGAGSAVTIFALLDVRKGQNIECNYTAGGRVVYFRFVYAQGNGDLYFKVANAVQNLELLDAGEVLEAVNNVVPDNSSLISSYAMPSGRAIDLTLGASGTTYTAPANGWFYLNKVAGSDWYYCEFTCAVEGSYDSLPCWGSDYKTSPIKIWTPVKKGAKIKVNYNATGKTNYFKFIYAEGEV